MHWRRNQLPKQLALLSTCFGSHCSQLLDIRFLTSLSKPHCTIDLWETIHMIDHDREWGWLKLAEILPEPSLVSLSGAGCGHSGPFSVFDCSKWFGGLWDRQSGLAAFADSFSYQKNSCILLHVVQTWADMIIYRSLSYCIFMYIMYICILPFVTLWRSLQAHWLFFSCAYRVMWWGWLDAKLKESVEHKVDWQFVVTHFPAWWGEDRIWRALKSLRVESCFVQPALVLARVNSHE